MPRLLLPPHKALSTPTELENGKRAAAESLLCDLTCHQKKISRRADDGLCPLLRSQSQARTSDGKDLAVKAAAER